MTRYFEVIGRDGPARRGRLRLERTINTPALISNDRIVSAGSLWGFGSVEEALEAADGHIDKDKLFIPPHVSVPLHVEPPVDLPHIETDGPCGLVVHPFFLDEPYPADVYIMGAAGSLRNPRELLKAVLEVKEKTPPDSALYAPALATPANLALLVYLGVDLVDSTRVVVDGYLGRYHTHDGTWNIEDLRELPCRCQHCRALEEEDRPDQNPNSDQVLRMISDHNHLKLEEEIRLVREMIRRGCLREYVEKSVRVTPEETTTLRLLDQEGRYLERRTPVFRKNVMYSNTAESLHRVEVTRYAKRVLNRYRAPESEVLLLLPCSARKPYSKSRSHRLFAGALGSWRKRIHEVILTSPLAVVPRELEEVYPAAHYDVPVTGRWDLEERDWLLRCLDAYLERSSYKKIIVHLDGELREAVEEHGVDAVYTGGGTNGEALSGLTAAVKEAAIDASVLDHKRLRVRAVTDYFFGSKSGDLLLAGEVRIKGREVQNGDKKTLATLTPNGTIALAIEGARRLEPMGAHLVEIGEFLPKGDVLSPGVINADEEIRPGDDVIVRGEMAFGVGRARMSGWEMVRSTRGVAVELRRVEEV